MIANSATGLDDSEKGKTDMPNERTYAFKEAGTAALIQLRRLKYPCVGLEFVWTIYLMMDHHGGRLEVGKVFPEIRKSVMCSRGLDEYNESK